MPNELALQPVLNVFACRTSLFGLGDDLGDFIIRELPKAKVKERSILCVTSKIMSLAERAVISRSEISKAELVRKEADIFVSENDYGTGLTIKQGLLIAAAGIDESNSRDDAYILYPRNPYASTQQLHVRLSSHYGLKELGIIITDSHTQPLRRGVTGIGIAHWGFNAVQTRVGTRDLFGRELKMTFINALDALAVAAVFVMGEGDESSPLALIEGAKVQFKSGTSTPDEVQIRWEEDLYRPLFSRWIEKSPLK
jgi:dihydrofolate synthase / folylpolyglutamate synthase